MIRQLNNTTTMDTKQIHEQRLWERYCVHLERYETRPASLEEAVLDVQFFEEEIKARLERV